MKIRVELFSGPDCHYCEQARVLMDRCGIGYVSLDIAEDAGRTELARRLPHARTLPQIFIDGKHIGSYEDLVALEGKGELDGLKGVNR